MSEIRTFDAVVLGAGQAGYPLSLALAQAGWNTALIEKTHVGGTCVHEGCTPTKTMVASARVAYLARRATDYGIHIGTVSVDLQTVKQRKRTIVNRFATGILNTITSTSGLTFFKGEARFSGPYLVEVLQNDELLATLTAPIIFINTGARSVLPPVQGLDRIPVLDSTSIMELDEVPDHLIVLGGGYIGLEFGQMFRRFGSEVTIVQRSNKLLAREDDDVADSITDILCDEGIQVLLDTRATRASNEKGRINLEVASPDGMHELKGSHLLVATGRVPNTEKLNLPSTGVETDSRGFIHVNDILETTAPGIYALGDVNGGPAFTHISYDDFRVIRNNLLDGHTSRTTRRLVPYTVFVDPQLGRIGLTEKEALSSGYRFAVARLPMARVARAIEMDETRGFMKVIVDSDTKQILGAAVLGIEGGEIMSILQVAMMGGLPFTTLRDTIFAHPTLAESLNNLFSFGFGEEPSVPHLCINRMKSTERGESHVAHIA